jgi:hypothetical protein
MSITDVFRGLTPIYFEMLVQNGATRYKAPGDINNKIRSPYICAVVTMIFRA